MNTFMNPPRFRLFFPPFLLLLAAFATGVLFERAGWIPGRENQEPPGVRKTFGPFWEAWNRVKENYVDRSKVDDKLLTQGAISGMIRALGDENHSVYLTQDERERASKDLGGQMEGIGAVVNVRNGKITIARAMPNSPARAAGLRAGDIIASVDDQTTTGLSLTQVVHKILGPAGTEVRLRIDRPGDAKPLDLTIKRAKVEVAEVTWGLLPGQPTIAYVRLSRFSKNSAKQMKQALEELRQKDVKGMILDLRGNSGGLKEQCVELASEFLPEGESVCIQQDAQGKQEKVPALKGGSALKLPLVVLINRESASSSEILAGALQDHGRAKLVGTKTFGTGTILREFPLSDGSAVRLAIYQWLTPNGREIWHKGIPPDKGCEVALPTNATEILPDPETPITEADLKKSNDAPLFKAIEVLRGEMAH
jgi:carboxyl-terminal processing protease